MQLLYSSTISSLSCRACWRVGKYCKNVKSRTGLRLFVCSIWGTTYISFLHYYTSAEAGALLHFSSSLSSHAVGQVWDCLGVNVQGVKSLGGHFACLCWVFHFYEVKKNIFQKENGNPFSLLIIVLEKSLQKEQIAQITQYDPWSAGINLQSTQSDLTPRILTLVPQGDIKAIIMNITRFGNKLKNLPCKGKHHQFNLYKPTFSIKAIF